MEVFIFKFFIINILSTCPILIEELSTLNHKFLDLMKRASFQFHNFPGGSDGKASAYNLGDPGLIPGSGRSPGEGNGNPLQYSCLESPMDGGAWWATVRGVTRSHTRLSDLFFLFQIERFPSSESNAYFSCTWLLSHFSHAQLFTTPWTVAYQAPLSMGFSRQEYWSRLPFPSPGESSWPRDWTHVSYVSCTGSSLPLPPPGLVFCTQFSCTQCMKNFCSFEHNICKQFQGNYTISFPSNIQIQDD